MDYVGKREQDWEMSLDQIVSSVANEDVESKMVTTFTPTVCVEVVEYNG